MYQFTCGMYSNYYLFALFIYLLVSFAILFIHSQNRKQHVFLSCSYMSPFSIKSLVNFLFLFSICDIPGIIISLKMYHGQLSQIKEENPLLFKNVSLTNKLGFPDVIMPGDVRNDLYLFLEKGEFERGGKSTGKNIEVTVLVLDSEKNIIKVLPNKTNIEHGTKLFLCHFVCCRTLCGELLVWKELPSTIPWLFTIIIHQHGPKTFGWLYQ